MGFLSNENENHLESIIYFLSEALRAAIEAGDSLQQSPCVMPQIRPGMDCSEIAGQLAAFRNHVRTLWSAEILLLTKILRARDLAKELRLQEPELKPEIDTFRLATVMAADLRDVLMPDVDKVFNGSENPKRFLEARGYGDVESSATKQPLPGYKIAGLLDVRLLIDACEHLHFGLATRYGFGASTSAAITADLTASGDGEGRFEEPFLLTELGEILADEPVNPPFGWQSPLAPMHQVRH